MTKKSMLPLFSLLDARDTWTDQFPRQVSGWSSLSYSSLHPAPRRPGFHIPRAVPECTFTFHERMERALLSAASLIFDLQMTCLIQNVWQMKVSNCLHQM